MSDIIFQISNLFTSNVTSNAITEDLIKVSIEIPCNVVHYPTNEEFDKLLNSINQRDNLHISFVFNENTCNYSSSEGSDFDVFVSDYKSFLINVDNFNLIVTIEKNKKDNFLSIYYIDKFVQYLKALSFTGQLSILNKALGNFNTVIFEFQGDSFQEFSTQTIKFIDRDRDLILDNNIDKDINNLHKTKNLCHCNIISKYKFIPEDFYPINKENVLLAEIFNRISLLYSAIFLLDIVNVNGNQIDYKLNGYKTINHQLSFLDIDISSCEIYNEIYKWVYEGGNIVDKIGLARNIISLNFSKDNLQLSDTTFDSIKSSFKIYQKENIKQYIEIRNKISDQLITLQNNADKIVDGYINDYKKSLLTIVSFFISVIVIRVVSKGDFTGGFTFEVTMLSLGFLTIFLLLMIYSRWEIKKQIERYKEFYENLKIRHGDLLHESDIKRILNDDMDFNKNISFIGKREKFYTILWISSFVLLLFIVLLLFSINNSCSFCCLIKNVFLKTILCFTRNI